MSNTVYFDVTVTYADFIVIHFSVCVIRQSLVILHLMTSFQLQRLSSAEEDVNVILNGNKIVNSKTVKFSLCSLKHHAMKTYGEVKA